MLGLWDQSVPLNMLAYASQCADGAGVSASQHADICAQHAVPSAL